MQEEVLVSTDCVCDLPDELVEAFEIPLMYYYVKTQEARFQDIKEISSDNLISYIQQGKKALSSSAAEEEYRMFFMKLRQKYPHRAIIHICMAKEVSSAYETASKAAQGLEEIYVVDSGHLSGGMAIMVLTAADMAKSGAVCALILRKLERLRTQVSSSFAVDSTEMLYRNGRIGRRVDRLCQMLRLHPILTLKDSRMFPVAVCMGKQRNFAKQYLRWALRDRKKVDTSIVFLITAGCSYEFQDFLKQELEQMLPWRNVVVNTASATISCNCGAGSFGILFMRKEQ